MVIVEGKVGATVWLLLPRDEPLSVVAREVWIRRWVRSRRKMCSGG